MYYVYLLDRLSNKFLERLIIFFLFFFLRKKYSMLTTSTKSPYSILEYYSLIHTRFYSSGFHKSHLYSNCRNVVPMSSVTPLSINRVLCFFLRHSPTVRDHSLEGYSIHRSMDVCLIIFHPLITPARERCV